jgi:hypothetical protein
MTETNSSMPTDNKPLKPLKVYSYPKIIFFYPLVIVSIICGILSSAKLKDWEPRHNVDKPATQVETIDAETPEVSETEPGVPNQAPVRKHFNLAEYAVVLFLLVFFLNMLIISFDFPGMKALATILIIALFFVVSSWLAAKYQLPILETLNRWIHQGMFDIHVSSKFYFYIAGVVALMIFIAIIHQRCFDQWIIEPTRLTHVKGIMKEYTEYPVIDLQVDKKIDDVFELLLLRAGTLVFRPNVNTAPIYLENVPCITTLEKKIKALTRNRLGK